jgi:hypothetical protein
MATPPPRLTGTAEWRALEAHPGSVAPRHLRDLFAADPAIVPELESGAELDLAHDSSTNALICRFRQGRGRR